MTRARWPAIVLGVAVLLALVAVLLIRRLHVDTSLASLFERDNPAAMALQRVTERFSAVEELLLLVEAPGDPPQTGKTIAFAQRLEHALATDPSAASLAAGFSFRADEQIRQFIEKEIVPNAIFYLDDAAFAAAQQRLTRDGIRDQIRRNEALIATPGPAAGAMAKTILKDPLRLHEFLLDRIAGGLPAIGRQGSGELLSRDGRALLIRIRGRRPVNDLEFSKRFTETIRTLLERVNVDRLHVDISGGYAIAARSQQAIRKDMIETVISSVIGLQLLFVLAFRQPVRTFLISFIPVAFGVLYGFGVYALLSRTLSPMTAVIGGILAGMAIDHSIAFLTFYHARRHLAATASDAAGHTVRNVGTTLLAAWATSIAGFVVISFSNVRALREFALLGGLGLTGAFICALVVHPAVLVVSDPGTPPRGPLLRLPIDRVLPALLSHRRGVIFTMMAIFTLAACSLLLPGPILPLESDLSAMHPRPNAPLEALQTISQRMGTSPGGLMIHLKADDDAKLVGLAHTVASRLKRDDVRSAGIAGTLSLASLLPDPSLTESRIAATGAQFAQRVIADFRAVIADSMFDPAATVQYEQFLRTILTATQPPSLQTLQRYPKLAEMVSPRAQERESESIVLLFTRDATERREERDAVVQSIRSALADVPNATLTGLSVLGHDAEIAVRRDLPRLVLIALAAVTLYLAVHFRNLFSCMLATLPAIFAFACLFAFMRLTGQKLSMINLIAFPLLIGIGIDYGIFIVSASRNGDDRLVPAAAAVIMCAATTVLGFASLWLTSVPAVRSMGITVAFGVVSAAVAAVLLVLPLCVTLRRREPR